MNPHSLETTDIFRGAFFLCQGGKLAAVRLKEDARRIVSFLIEAEGIDQLDLDYRNGLALVNPLQFRESLNHLRDILFSKLRDPASHKCYAVTGPASSRQCRGYAAARGRTRYDRKGEDRRSQKEH